MNNMFYRISKKEQYGLEYSRKTSWCWYRSRKKLIIGLTVGSLHSACSVALSCSTLCGPMDCSTPGSSDHGISQARILECVVSFSRGSSWPRNEPASPASLASAGEFFTTKPPRKPHGIEARITIISGEKEDHLVGMQSSQRTQSLNELRSQRRQIRKEGLKFWLRGFYGL